MGCEEPATIRVKDRMMFGMRGRVVCQKHANMALDANRGASCGRSPRGYTIWYVNRDMEFEVIE